MGRPMAANMPSSRRGGTARNTDPIASDASRQASQALVPDELIMVAPFGQERGATPQGGPGKPGRPVAMAGRGQGREGAWPSRIRRPIGPRPFEAPPWSRLHRRPRRGVAARLPPGAVEALPEDHRWRNGLGKP